MIYNSFFMHKQIKTAVCVVGGGSGGFAAALRASQSGCQTVLVEKEPFLGGTSTVSVVNCWEPVAGASFGLPRELYDRMRRIPRGCGIYAPKLHRSLGREGFRDFPGGFNAINPKMTYDDTLKKGFDYRKISCPEIWNGVVFEPEVWDRCAREMLKENSCAVQTGRTVAEVKYTDEQIHSVILDDGTEIEAKIWIDNSGYLAAASGCHLLYGSEPRRMFQEPDAPEEPTVRNLNGVTLIFRVTPTDKPGIEPLSFELAGRENANWMVATEYPDGDLCCNMLPTLRGADYLALGENTARKVCEDLVRIFWHTVQEQYDLLRHYKFKSFAAKLGIRESFRTFCEVMLTENDVLNGISGQDQGDWVVISDHQLDRHGAGGPARPVRPYGISYRSLLPKGKENLLVAGKIGGFSCLASTSCRLSRTIMRIGEAAGYAAALAVKNQYSLRSVDIRQLQELMHFKEEKETACSGIK